MSSSRSFKTHLILLSAVLSRIANATCYFPDGTIAASHRLCHVGVKHSVCCRDGYGCLSNGVCSLVEYAWRADKVDPVYLRGSCTDETWRDPVCPKFCLEDGTDGNPEYGMIRCENANQEVFLCQTRDGRNCSDREWLVSFSGTASLVGPYTLINAITSSSEQDEQTTTTSTAGTVTSKVETVVQSASPSPSKDPTNKGAIIGGAIGGAISILVLGGLVLFWFFSRLHKNQQKAKTAGPEQCSGTGVMPKAELPVPSIRHEVPETLPPQELPTSFNTKSET